MTAWRKQMRFVLVLLLSVSGLQAAVVKEKPKVEKKVVKKTVKKTSFIF